MRCELKNVVKYSIALEKINSKVTTSRSSRPEVFCKKDVPKIFTKFIGKHLRQSLFLNEVAGLRSATLLKKRL